MMRDRDAFLNFPQPDVTSISGNLHANQYVAMYFGQVSMHVYRVGDLRKIAAVASRLADELETAQAAEISEADRLRARIAELEAAAGGAA